MCELFQMEYCTYIPERRRLHCDAFWWYLYNLKNVKKTHWGLLILVKLQGATIVNYLLLLLIIIRF